MTLRFSALALPIALLAGCGGQIDGSIFDPSTDAALGNDATGDDASVLPADASPVEPDATPIGPDTALPPPAETGPTPPPPGAVGTPCMTSAQCTTGHCSGGRCTTTCNSASDCVSGWYCSQTTAGKLCRCTPAGQDCGGQDKNCDGVVTSNAPCTAPPPADAGPAPTCTSCAQSACGSQAQTCYFDAVCKNFLTCAQACGTYTGTCVSQCVNKNNDAATQALMSCMATNCAGCT
jgi:hypothetical protein